MTILSDTTLIEGIVSRRIGIEDPEGSIHQVLMNVQPASVDLTLGNSFRTFRNHAAPLIDLADKGRVDCTEEHVADEFILHPGEFALASTHEIVRVPDDLVAQVNGKSSLGRLGLIVHATAGFIDPGFHGSITLELSNLLRMPIKLHAGMRIAQICFSKLDQPCAEPYGSDKLGSHYQGQTSATSSRYEG
jgi:dCTP deaminase